MNKAFITSVIMWVLSFAVVTLTVDGSIPIGDFSLVVPADVYSGAVWLLGISTTVTVPVGVKAWLANKYNIMMNAGLQDMKLTHIMEQNALLLQAQEINVKSNFNAKKDDKDALVARMVDSGIKTMTLANTYANYVSVNPEQKLAYFKHQIEASEILRTKAEQIGDTKTVKALTKTINSINIARSKL